MKNRIKSFLDTWILDIWSEVPTGILHTSNLSDDNLKFCIFRIWVMKIKAHSDKKVLKFAIIIAHTAFLGHISHDWLTWKFWPQSWLVGSRIKAAPEAVTKSQPISRQTGKKHKPTPQRGQIRIQSNPPIMTTVPTPLLVPCHCAGAGICARAQTLARIKSHPSVMKTCPRPSSYRGHSAGAHAPACIISDPPTVKTVLTPLLAPSALRRRLYPALYPIQSLYNI